MRFDSKLHIDPELKMDKSEKPRSGSKSDLIRTFICIEIPVSIKDRIAKLQQRLGSIDAQVSWIKPENIHLTLKFLGSIPAARIDNLRLAVERAAIGRGPFQLEAGGTGCFPSARRPRVLWVGLSAVTQQIQGLHEAIETESEIEGFPRETRRFEPHLTIGRFRSSPGSTKLAEELISIGLDTEAFNVTDVVVMRSDLRPSGAIYSPQAVIPLKSLG